MNYRLIFFIKSFKIILINIRTKYKAHQEWWREWPNEAAATIDLSKRCQILWLRLQDESINYSLCGEFFYCNYLLKGGIL